MDRLYIRVYGDTWLSLQERARARADEFFGPGNYVLDELEVEPNSTPGSYLYEARTCAVALA